MKRKLYFLIVLGALLLLGTGTARAQAFKTNAPLLLGGTPNFGVEFTISNQFSINGDILWMPYMKKKHEEVFRALIGSVDLRYYINPKYYYTHEMYDGFYLGPYAMYGQYNIGLKKKDDNKDSFRYKGWGVSAGLTIGYKFYVSPRFRIDVNLGVGYAHLQHNKYYLGGEWADMPLEKKMTKAWIGPTKFGIHLVYNLFR